MFSLPKAGNLPLPIDVISIQSQVVYGSVGNSIAVPTLLSHGLRVACVPTVLLSNKPDYPSVSGGAIPYDWFVGYLDDLKERGVLNGVRAVITGYLGSVEQGLALAHWLKQLKTDHPDVLVIVDPVLGDHETGFYVAPDLRKVYRDHLLAVADGVTPNAFELRHLSSTDPSAESNEDMARSLLKCHQNLKWVVVTSSDDIDLTRPPSDMRLLAVTPVLSAAIRHPKVLTNVKGTGDMLAAELLAYLLSGSSLIDAVRFSAQRVLRALCETSSADLMELLPPEPAR